MSERTIISPGPSANDGARDRDFRPIADYGLLADCNSAALVDRYGSIDWLCLPRFDSAACFAALLGEPKHGRWLIAPREPIQQSRVGARQQDGHRHERTTAL